MNIIRVIVAAQEKGPELFWELIEENKTNKGIQNIQTEQSVRPVSKSSKTKSSITKKTAPSSFVS